MTTQKTVGGQGLLYVSGWTWGTQLCLQRSKARSQPSIPRADVSGGDAEAETVKINPGASQPNSRRHRFQSRTFRFSATPGVGLCPETGQVLAAGGLVHSDIGTRWQVCKTGQTGKASKETSTSVNPSKQLWLPGKCFLTVTSRGKCLQGHSSNFSLHRRVLFGSPVTSFV